MNTTTRIIESLSPTQHRALVRSAERFVARYGSGEWRWASRASRTTAALLKRGLLNEDDSLTPDGIAAASEAYAQVYGKSVDEARVEVEEEIAKDEAIWEAAKAKRAALADRIANATPEGMMTHGNYFNSPADWPGVEVADYVKKCAEDRQRVSLSLEELATLMGV